MLSLPHTIIGAAIATKIADPTVALPLAFLSHFLADITPHWNPHLNLEVNTFGKVTKKSKMIVVVDTLLALALGLFFALRFWPDIPRVLVVIFACFFAVLPDLTEAPYFFLGWKNKYLIKLIKFQKRIQFHVPANFGLVFQVIVSSICFWLIFS